MSLQPQSRDPVEPGWYLDPADWRHHRYWTGTEWVSQDEALDESHQGDGAASA